MAFIFHYSSPKKIPNRLYIGSLNVIFEEDAAPFADYNASTNWSFIRNIAINIVWMYGYASRTIAKRFLARDIEKLIFLLK